MSIIDFTSRNVIAYDGDKWLNWTNDWLTDRLRWKVWEILSIDEIKNNLDKINIDDSWNITFEWWELTSNWKDFLIEWLIDQILFQIETNQKIDDKFKKFIEPLVKYHWLNKKFKKSLKLIWKILFWEIVNKKKKLYELNELEKIALAYIIFSADMAMTHYGMNGRSMIPGFKFDQTLLRKIDTYLN